MVIYSDAAVERGAGGVLETIISFGVALQSGCMLWRLDSGYTLYSLPALRNTHMVLLEALQCT